MALISVCMAGLAAAGAASHNALGVPADALQRSNLTDLTHTHIQEPRPQPQTAQHPKQPKHKATQHPRHHPPHFSAPDGVSDDSDALAHTARKRDFCNLKVDESLAWLQRRASVSFPLGSTARALTAADVEELTAAAVRTLESEEWELMQTKQGVTVWKARPHSQTHAQDPEAAKYPCIKCEALIDATPEEILDLMLDSSRVHEYNKYSTGRTDVEIVAPGTKVVWNRTRPPLTMKGHDFCTLMHCYKMEDESYIMVSKGIDHPLVPKHNDYTRSEIVFSVNVLSKASPAHPHQTKLTSITHMRYGGVPSYLANKVCVQAAHDFIRNLQLASLTTSRFSST